MADTQQTTFEQGGTEYEIMYVPKRIEMAEAALGNRSVVQVFGQMPTIKDERTVVAYGLREVGSAAWVNPTRAMQVVDGYIGDHGMVSLMNLAAEALSRDCGFLFQ